MKKLDRSTFLIKYFSKHRPFARTELVYNNPFELIVAVVLSAQCTDKRVNIITKKLFSKLSTPSLMAKAEVSFIFDLIKSCSYPMSKANYLSSLSKMLVSDFDSIVPYSLNDLQRLPGVGRKTANVVRSVYFDIPSMPVDTHVFRVANRVGLTTNSKNVLQSEKQLVRLFPAEKLNIAHHWLILHGRYVCKARNPDCYSCGISSVCKEFNLKNKKGSC